MSGHPDAASTLSLTPAPLLAIGFRPARATDPVRGSRARTLSIALTALMVVGATGTWLGPDPDPAEAAAPDAEAATTTATSVAAYGRVPMTFEANAGQVDASVRYVARGAGYTVFLTDAGATLSLLSERDTGDRAVVRLETVGGAARPSIAGVDRQPGRVNHLTGDDPAAWRTGLPTFARVRYHDVYPGVDLVFYGNQRQLEYDFVVAPGADPGAIRLAFPGAEGMRLARSGDLVLEVGGRELVQHAPVVYQEVGGTRRSVAGRYVLDRGHVTFALGAYDPRLPLVIDPVIAYSTYLGGTSSEIAHGIAVDGAGNAYIAGQTTSADFPTVGASQPSRGGGDFDAFVAKLNASGTGLVYATYLGGSGFDEAADIAVDGAGNAYVAGVTSSADFPTVGAFQSTFRGIEDAFVTKLSATGSTLVYSSYLGGAGDDGANAVAVDGSGNVYLTGFTDSVAFPTRNPIQAAKGATLDAFVTKVSAAGSALVYSTYLGGDVDDLGHGIAVDAAGNAYVAGETLSGNFPRVNPIQAAAGGAFDGFVTKVNAAGSALAYSTYLGGNGTDGANDIAIDPAGNAYVTGATQSANFPITTPLDGSKGGTADAFVTKLNAAGSARVYSTYLGGATADFGLSGLDEGFGIAVDTTGAAHVTGYTQSTDFPRVAAVQSTIGSFQDAFVAKLTPAGTSLQHATYLGGGGNDEEGQAIAVHGSGAAFVAGLTDSSDFRTTTGAFQTTLPSRFQGSAFVTRLTYEPPPAPTVSLGPDLRIAEGSPGGTTNLDFTVSLSAAHTQQVTVRYGTSAGTTNPATAGSDYTAVTGGLVTIPAGQTSAVARVAVTRDAADELDETFRVTLSSPVGATLAGDGLAIGTIVNDDDPKLTIADLSRAEGHSGSTTFPFSVTLSGASLQPVTLRYSTASGATAPATAGSDYTAVTGATLTIPAGTLSVGAPVTVVGDTLGEADETFRVTIFGQSNAAMADAQAVGTIVNDDGAQLPTISMGSDLNLPEGSPTGTTNFDFRVGLSAVHTQPVTVRYTTSAGPTNPGTAGSDYTAVTGGLVTIPAGQTSAVARVMVTRDAVDEPNETFRVTLSDAAQATLAGDGFALGTIRNDDDPLLRIADLARAEGNSGTTAFQFTVSLSTTSGDPVTFRYSTVAGTTNPATAGADYTTVSNASVTIPAGSLSATATVNVTGDTLVEPNETFRVTLASPTNAVVADGLAVGTITTDDADATPPVVGAPAMDFRANLSLPVSTTPIPIRVSFTATDASGIASTNLQQQVDAASFADIPLAPANATAKDLLVAPSDTTTRRFRARATDAAIPANMSAFSTGPVHRVRAFQDGSPSIVQTGKWTSVSNTNHYGGTVRQSAVAGHRQSLTAVMSDVALVSTRASDRGIAKVFVDGVEKATIDLYSASAQYRRVVYQLSFAGAPASHTVELRVLGTKNAASTGTRVDLDAFLAITP